MSSSRTRERISLSVTKTRHLRIAITEQLLLAHGLETAFDNAEKLGLSDFDVEMAAEAAAGTAMAFSDGTIRRMHERVDQLVREFADCCQVFDGTALFTGPSVYFHSKAITIRRRHTSVAELATDDAFWDALYATLTSWGIHRRGPGQTKLLDLPNIRHSLLSHMDRIVKLESYRIDMISDAELPSILEELWAVLSEIKVGIAESRIVVNSKTLHHVLPDLMPPVDRRYTIRFFFHSDPLSSGEQPVFATVCPLLHRIGVSCRQVI